MPSYSTVHAIMRQLDPGLVTLTHDDAAAYRDQFELIHRHRSDRPNTLWQADHTELDLMILDANGNPARPWLTVVIDDHSRAIAGYAVFFGAPSALQLALALRRAIWRKADPAWPICGIPDVLYVDHGSDFTSRHLKQVTADLRVELTFSTVGRPQGRGKVERFFGTVTSELLPELPGYLVGGRPAKLPGLSLSDLDNALGAFITQTYNARVHREIGATPNTAWVAEGWLPRVPHSLEELDLLIIDELGFVPLSKTGAELLFELISQRYERGATIITSNLPFDEWTATFGEERLTGALLDRLTHHVHVLEMNGKSYRLAQSRSKRNR